MRNYRLPLRPCRIRLDFPRTSSFNPQDVDVLLLRFAWKIFFFLPRFRDPGVQWGFIAPSSPRSGARIRNSFCLPRFPFPLRRERYRPFSRAFRLKMCLFFSFFLLDATCFLLLRSNPTHDDSAACCTCAERTLPHPFFPESPRGVFSPVSLPLCTLLQLL